MLYEVITVRDETGLAAVLIQEIQPALQGQHQPAFLPRRQGADLLVDLGGPVEDMALHWQQS